MAWVWKNSAPASIFFSNFINWGSIGFASGVTMAPAQNSTVPSSAFPPRSLPDSICRIAFSNCEESRSKTPLAALWSPTTTASPVRQRTFLMPLVYAKRSSACRARRLRSRQVTCNIGSPPRSLVARQPPTEGKRITELWWSVTFSASTLSLRRSIWGSIFSMFVSLGGPISLVITNLPDLRTSLKLGAIAPPLYDPDRSRSGCHVVVSGGMMFTHQIKSSLFFQSLIYESPGTVLFFIHLALTVIGAATWAVEQTFVTCRQRTNARRLSQDALTALDTDFLKTAGTILDTYEESIQRGNSWLVKIGAQLLDARTQ